MPSRGLLHSLIAIGVAMAALDSAHAEDPDKGAAVDQSELQGQLLEAIGRSDMRAVKKLLKEGADVNRADPHTAETPLHRAAGEGAVGMAELLLDRGAAINARDFAGQTPLFVACRDGRRDVVALLVARGADVTVLSYEEGSPLDRAAASGDTAVLAILLSKLGSPGPRPLHEAAKDGRIAVVRLLLDNGIDADGADGGGMTALHWAACAGEVEPPPADDYGTAEMQQGSGFGGAIGFGDASGTETPAQRCFHDIAKLLLDKGAAVDARDKGGRTPLAYCVGGGVGRRIDGSWRYNDEHLRIARLLMERGATLQDVDPDGHSPLEWVASRGESAFAKELVERGAELRVEGGGRLLHAATRGGLSWLMRVCLEKGAPVNETDDYTGTPLHIAAEAGADSAAALLLRHGADVNIPNDFDETPLHVCASNGRVSLAAALIEHGAQLSPMNAEGQTPLDRALAGGNRQLVAMLKKAGAKRSAELE